MKKLLMIGLDGATYALLKPLIADGYMPFLGKVMAEGAYGDLMSTPNPLTPPGWISTVTGCSPDVHGIYDFLRPESTEEGVFLKVNDSRDILCDTVWTLASRQGKRVTTLNFYGMSPPVPVDGYLISGFIPWRHLRSATYPESLFDTVKNLPNVDIKKLGMDIGEEKKCIQGLPEEEYEEWIHLQSERDAAWTELLSHLMQSDPTDLTAIVYDGTDKIQHLFWRYLDPSLVDATTANPWDTHIRELCLNYYRQIDQSIERLVALSGPDTHLVITSDHGFGPTHEVVYLNEWLARNGYLTWTAQTNVDNTSKLTADRIKDHTLMIDWEHTLAYSLTPSSNAIYVKQAKDGDIGVSAEEYPNFCRALQQKLLDYRHPIDGGQVFAKADLNENRLAGKASLEHAPDITLGLRDGGFVSILRSAEVVKTRDKVDGTHRPNGVFIAWGPDIASGKHLDPLSILDVTPMLLHLMGLEIPKEIEGRVPVEALRGEALSANPVRFSEMAQPARPKAAADRPEISEDEKDALMAQLKLLGYMD